LWLLLRLLLPLLLLLPLPPPSTRLGLLLLLLLLGALLLWLLRLLLGSLLLCLLLRLRQRRQRLAQLLKLLMQLQHQLLCVLAFIVGAEVVAAHKHAVRVYSDGEPARHVGGVKAGGDHGCAGNVLQAAQPACTQAKCSTRWCVARCSIAGSRTLPRQSQQACALVQLLIN
jgi:hypothetical protein